MMTLFKMQATLATFAVAGTLVLSPTSAQEQAAQPATVTAEEPAAATPEPANDPLARGKYLATAGNCMTCHTREGGAPFAGGVAFKTDFGTIYSTNITSDPKAGIGSWTQEQFVRAMREGFGPMASISIPPFHIRPLPRSVMRIWARFLPTSNQSRRRPLHHQPMRWVFLSTSGS